MRGEKFDMSTDESGDVAASSGPYTTSKTSLTPPNSIASPETPSSRHSLTLKHNALGEEENARSAFEITSVTDAPADADELESSMRNPGQSSDEQQLRENLDKGNMSQSRSPGMKEERGVPTGGASRFRRVNHYIRGRWAVYDTSEPEERADTDLAARSNTQLLRSEGVASPSVARRVGEEDHRSVSELLVPSGAGDSETVERTAADATSLSRDTSISSLAPTEKSVENDEHLRGDNDPSTEPVTYAPSVQDSHGPSCLCESCAPKTHQKRRVKTALESLQEELNSLLKSNARLDDLTREKDNLLEENTKMRQTNVTLTTENKKMRSRLTELETLVQEKDSLLSEYKKRMQEAENRYEELLRTSSLSEHDPSSSSIR